MLHWLVPMPSMTVMLAKRMSCSTALRNASNSILRRASRAGNSMTPILTVDHRNTVDVPCSQTTSTGHIGRIDAQPLGHVRPKSPTVEMGAGAHDAIVAGELARRIGQWFRRTGSNHNHGHRVRLHQLRHDVLDGPSGWR
jgi:hypothetical protein